MIVRTIQDNDIAAVAEAHAAAWKKAFRGILSDQLLEGFGGLQFEENWKEIINRKEPHQSGGCTS